MSDNAAPAPAPSVVGSASGIKPRDIEYPHLSSAKQALNVRSVMERAKLDLEKILKDKPGDKILVLDEQIIGPMSHIAESKFLKDNGAKMIYKLNNKPFDTPVKNIIYIVRPKIHLMKWIGVQVKHFLQLKQEWQKERAKREALKQQQAQSKDKNKKKGAAAQDAQEEEDEDVDDKNISVYLVPRITLICRRVLHELDIAADITLGEYPLDLIPFDYDVLTMEIPSAFKECYLDGDLSSLYYVARAVMKLQAFYGLIPHIKVKGQCAMSVLDMVLRMRRQIGPEVLNTVPEIDTLILFDRQADLISPMFTQLTYEGLIDELFGVKNSFLQPTFPCIPEQKAGQRPKIWLRSTDSVFADIRDLNQQYVGSALKKKAVKIDEQINERKNLKTVQQIKDFTTKLPALQEDKKNLEMHINIIQFINQILGQREFRRLVEQQLAIIMNDDDKGTLDLLEDYISRQEPITKVLRLMCMWSLVNNGIKTKVYDSLRQDLLHVYGLECLLTINNLERIGLLKRQEGRSPWPTLRKTLGLVKEANVGGDEIHSVHAGYAPLSVRLMEEAPNPKGWENIKDMLDLLPGPTVEFQQKGAMVTQQDRKVVLCFFIGGVTFAEMSAIRLLNEKYARPTEDGRPGRVYLIASTKLINGHTLLESLIEPIGNIHAKTQDFFLKQQLKEADRMDEEQARAQQAQAQQKGPAQAAK